MIIVAFKRLMEWIMLFALFLLFTLIIYKLVFMVNDWLQPIDKFKEPSGRSIKVIEMSPNQTEINLKSTVDRLHLFYIVGE